MQPRLFSLSIIRAELPDKTLCLSLDSAICSSLTCSPFDSGRREWERTKLRVARSSPRNEILYDSLANPVNMTAVLIHLLIVIKL